MGGRKKKSSRFSKYLTLGGNPNAPAGGLASLGSDSDPQSSEEQKSLQAGPSTPTTSRGSRFLNKLGLRSPSPSHEVEGRNNTPYLPNATASNSPQSFAVPAGVLARPHSSYSGSSALQMQGSPLHDLPPTAAGGNVTTVPSGGHGSSASPCAQGSSSMTVSAPFVPVERRNNTPDQPTDAGGSPSSGAQGSSTMSVSAPIIQISHSQPESVASNNPVPPSPSSLHIPTSICPVQASAGVDVHIAPHMKSAPDPNASSQVWAKALEIAKKQLSVNNLPPLDLTNLTSQSAEKNIGAVVKALNTVLEDDKKKRWSYTWHGKGVIVVERLGKILKSVEKYTKVVDIAIQSNPQVSALVWAGVWAIMRVRIDVLSLDAGTFN